MARWRWSLEQQQIQPCFLTYPHFRLFNNNIFDQLSVCLAKIIFASLFYYLAYFCYYLWNKRVNIIEGVAHTLSYMHHDCSPPIVHRDISNKNILLDSQYEAHVSDFDIAKLLNQDSSNWTSLASTYGYVAPGNTLHFLINIEHRAY